MTTGIVWSLVSLSDTQFDVNINSVLQHSSHLETLTSETNDAFLVEGEGGVEEDLRGGEGGVRWLPPVPMLDDIIVGLWKLFTSMKETDLPRFRGGGRRCSKGNIG